MVTNTTGTSARPGRQQCLQRRHVHVALERVDRRRVATLGDDQVDGLRAGGLDVRPGRVEVGVVRDHLARTADDREQDLLGGPALVGRDDVAERPQLGDGVEEREPRRRPGVRLVAVLDGGPLVTAHRAGAGIRQQVDQDVVGVEREQVQAGDLDRLGALVAGGHPDGFDRVDPERLDDRPEGLHDGSLAGRPERPPNRSPRRRWCRGSLYPPAMCRSIKTLRRAETAATTGELEAAARQFVRKISGYRTPSSRNADAFEAAIAEIAHSSEHLLEALGVEVEEGPDRWTSGGPRARPAANASPAGSPVA